MQGWHAIANIESMEVDCIFSPFISYNELSNSISTYSKFEVNN